MIELTEAQKSAIVSSYLSEGRSISATATFLRVPIRLVSDLINERGIKRSQQEISRRSPWRQLNEAARSEAIAKIKARGGYVR